MTKFCIETYINNLPENTEIINVNNKQIKFLPDLTRFTNLEALYCDNNQLLTIPSLNANLCELICSYNQLTTLPTLNENLQILCCNNNQLTNLPSLNKNLKTFWYDNNPIYEIINSHKFVIIKKKINILHTFCHLYYCLKFKKQFRDLLWKKIREPKIIQKYHPSYLLKFLKDDNEDIDMVLNNWL